MGKKSYTYEEFIKKYFPKDWKSRKEVCIHCHQKIVKEEPFEELPKKGKR